MPLPNNLQDSEEAEMEAAIAASLAQAQQNTDQEKEVAKSDDDVLLDKLKEMRKIKP